MCINIVSNSLQGTNVNLLMAYPFDCTLFRLICLTVKVLRRITMRDFLVGATEPEKRTLKRVQLKNLGYYGIYSRTA